MHTPLTPYQHLSSSPEILNDNGPTKMNPSANGSDDIRHEENQNHPQQAPAPQRSSTPASGKEAKDDKTKKPRKRTSRACDQCNQLRTKCDGLQPCAHCQELKLSCNYLRVPQKRGKASLTYIESAGRKAAAKENMKKHQLENHNHPDQQPNKRQSNGMNPNMSSLAHYSSYPTVEPSGDSEVSAAGGVDSNSNPSSAKKNGTDESTTPFIDSQADLNFNDMSRRSTLSNHLPVFSPLLEGSPSQLFAQSPGWFAENGLDSNGNQPPNQSNQSHNHHHHHEQQHHHHQSNNQDPAAAAAAAAAATATVPVTQGSNEFYRSIPVTTAAVASSMYQQAISPLPSDFFPQTSRTSNERNKHDRLSEGLNLRYPVLAPIVDSLQDNNLSVRLAEDLLETYFARPAHVLAYLVRKVSVLSTSPPRKCSAALLYSMLLIAAHDSDNPIVTGTPSSRQAIITKLMDLTTAHLSTAVNATATGTLDEVIAYVQLGTIVSASEYKGSSLRWWGVAWALAKELKLNQEITELDPETREERRRTWWLLYTVDRHLGLCYNRPLMILDSESSGLYQPEAEDIWQSDAPLTPPEAEPDRRELGICHMVTGQGIYGYFLPLMSILGMLLEIHHAEQHPLLPMKDISHQLRGKVRTALDQYATSLKNWNPVPHQQAYNNAWKDYALQLVHVFHILYSVSWDPVELLNSENLMGHPDIAKVTNHAVLAAKSIRRILSVDPDLTLMPFFFGVYLLQGSFILLAIVDRVESDASPEVFAACETIVHAHEVCIATLNTEYQRNFRRVMRTTMSLLASSSSSAASSGDKHTPSSVSSFSPTNPMGVQGERDPEKEEARRRRQDVLGLYRWIAGGHGLAV